MWVLRIEYADGHIVTQEYDDYTTAERGYKAFIRDCFDRGCRTTVEEGKVVIYENGDIFSRIEICGALGVESVTRVA